jgi:phospholipase C
MSKRKQERKMSLDHIIVLMLENNSFDRLLGGLFRDRPDANNPGGGIKGSESTHANIDATTGRRYSMVATTTREVQDDPGHDLSDVLFQIAGPNQGYVTNFAQKYPASHDQERQEIMSFYPDGYLTALHPLAKNFTVCDRWFSSMPGPTWPNRCFVHSGTSLGFTDMKALHFWDQTTLYDLLAAKPVDFRIYYTDVASTYILVHQPDPSNLAPLRYFFQDASGDEAKFPKYCFIDPGYFGKNASDQHPPHDVRRGEALIANVYNALRSNDKLWQRSLLVITYDEHGGFYDHIDPATTIAPDARRDGSGFNFDKLGVRVPAVLVSPWLDQGVLTDTFDHTSLLKFVVEKFGLDHDLGARVDAAGTNTFGKYLRKTPRNTANVLPKIPVPEFVPARENVPLSEHQLALANMSQTLATQIANPSVRQSVLRRPLDPTPENISQTAIDQFEAFMLESATQRAVQKPKKAKRPAGAKKTRPAKAKAKKKPRTNRKR